MPARHRLATLVAVAGGLLVWAASLATFLTPGAGGPDRAHPSCRMSYMWPNYVQVPGFEPNVTAAGRGVLRYSVSLYREGGGMDPDPNEQLGLPVLFIPGNAGSSHQVRSLGRALSELRRVYAPAGISLDIYTINTHGELAAFDPELVLDQAAFANEAIRHILDRHNAASMAARGASSGSRPPVESVLVVGHSMGGVVARSLWFAPNYVAGSVETLVTLATPHAGAPVALTRGMVALYEQLEEKWRAAAAAAEKGQESGGGVGAGQLLVSVMGGARDTMVRSQLGEVRGILPATASGAAATAGFTAYSTGVPTVWASADHRAIVWCKQLVVVLARMMYEFYEPSTGRVRPLAERLAVARAHLSYDFNAPPAALGDASGVRMQLDVQRGSVTTVDLAAGRWAIDDAEDGGAGGKETRWFELSAGASGETGEVTLLYSEGVLVLRCESPAEDAASSTGPLNCILANLAHVLVPFQLPRAEVDSKDHVAVLARVEGAAFSGRGERIVVSVPPGGFAAAEALARPPTRQRLGLGVADAFFGRTVTVPTPDLETVLDLPLLRSSQLALRTHTTCVRAGGYRGTPSALIVHASSNCSSETRFLLPAGAGADGDGNDAGLAFHEDLPCGQTWRVWSSAACEAVRVRVNVDWAGTGAALVRRQAVGVMPATVAMVLLAVWVAESSPRGLSASLSRPAYLLCIAGAAQLASWAVSVLFQRGTAVPVDFSSAVVEAAAALLRLAAGWYVTWALRLASAGMSAVVHAGARFRPYIGSGWFRTALRALFVLVQVPILLRFVVTRRMVSMAALTGWLMRVAAAISRPGAGGIGGDNGGDARWQTLGMVALALVGLDMPTSMARVRLATTLLAWWDSAEDWWPAVAVLAAVYCYRSESSNSSSRAANAACWAALFFGSHAAATSDAHAYTARWAVGAWAAVVALASLAEMLTAETQARVDNEDEAVALAQRRMEQDSKNG